MRAILFTFLLIVSLLSGNAQITMNLKTLEFTRNLQNTIPLRDIVEEEDGVTVTYIFNHVNILNDPLYKNARIVKIDGFWPNTSVGTPAFLLRWDTFIVPNRNAKIIVVDSTFIDYPMELSPARPVLSNSSNGTFSKDNVKPIAHYNGLYPCNVIPATRKDEYRGINLLDVCINPVQYDFNNKKVRFFTVSHQ